MIPSVPESIVGYISDHLNADIKGFSFCSGGCINHGGKLTTSKGNLFLKWNDRQSLPQMFDAEARGLRLLREMGVISIPDVFIAAETGYSQFIVMEYVDPGPKSPLFWITLGHQLAMLHKVTADQFGLDHNNYIGSLPQINNFNPSWVEFFIEKRLRAQLRLAIDNRRLGNDMVLKFERLFSKLPSMLCSEVPALLHGDLWSGNLIIGKHGDPCLIDPAVYYGHREAEIAFTRLFGGFPSAFYNAYQEKFPLAPGFRERMEVYNLYPLLVHVNLFGGGYASQVVSILDHFV